MLLTFFLSIIAMLIDTFFVWFIDLFPQINIPIFVVPTAMTDIVEVINYFLPMNTIWTCFSVMMGVTVMRIAVAVLLRIKSFIPFISST